MSENRYLWKLVQCGLLLVACALLGVSCGSREQRTKTAARDGILLLGNGTEPSTLDPNIANGLSEHHVFMALFEGLVSELPDRDDGVEPAVAESWESNGRKDVWTFHLRPSAKWSNGDPVLAGDFVFSYQRLLTPKIGAEYAAMLFLLKNGEAFNQGKITDFKEVGVKALDDHTLRLELIGPTPHLPFILVHYSWWPLHPATILKFGRLDQRLSRWTQPGNIVGNGPFQLKAWHFQHSIETVKNPHYWDAAKVKLKGITFFPINNESTEERMFRDHQLHVTELVPLDKIPKYRAEQPEVYQQVPHMATYFYRINTTRPGLNNPKARQALALAVDRKSLVEKVTRGGQTPATGMVPPMGAYPGVPGLEFNPEKARQLLAEAGYPGGKGFPRFNILINTAEAHRTVAEAIQDMWKTHLGIEVGINNQEWQVYLAAQNRLDYDVCRAGWTADYPDPMTFLDLWTTSNGNNETGFASPEYDALIGKVQQCSDANARLELLKQAEAMFLREMPSIPMYWYSRTYLVSKHVRGWHPKLSDNHPYKYVEMVPEAEAP